ncbi:MAG: fused HPr family phosphocarrier protein/2-hydroxyacid dehydrogenase [Erysipelotrichaceae bacterium]|nr:fused HPr family phosphocarrier protein/2-hydroxyacid dehydrogenase [Erysipelotrichaceae bacterium]MDO5121855.1 fused HPr family phosphocarrier protein/2-hydroxyacid dehydrogenase [Erysipelotrichaceae bacterium]
MKSFTYVLTDPEGLHARPAVTISQTCVQLQSAVTFSYNGKTAAGNNVLQLLALGAKHGAELEVTIEGPDEEEAVEKVLHDLRHKAEEHSAKPLRVAFFGTKDYDRLFFSELAKDKGPTAYNCDIHYFTTRLTPETANLAHGYDAVCIFVNDECPRSVVEELHEGGVKLILLRCAGFNNVDMTAAKECGMTVVRVPAYSPYAVAEHAMSIIQAANRRLCKAYNKVNDNNFALSGLLGLDLHNKTAGILGTGRIGQCFARICKGYGMTVIGWDAYPNQKLVDEGLLTYVSKEELLRKSDLISLHAPLIMGEGGTYHMINKDTIAMMKENVMLVNTARGGLIDAEALIDALKARKFHAVALDVYEGEDSNVYTDHSDDYLETDITARLTMFPNVVLTSHQAFFTREALQAIAATTMENARNFNRGRELGIAEVK